jgi:heptosyltransferase III
MTVNAIDQLPHGARIAVIRLRSLGDCVLTTPALDLLRKYRPDLRIGVAVEDRFRQIFLGHPAVAQTLAPTIGGVRRFGPAVTINLHGGRRSKWMTLLSGAHIRAGFGHFEGASAYNIKIPRAQQILGEERTVHTAEHLASAMFYLGVPISAVPKATLYSVDRPDPGAYAVVHPFASAPGKEWPRERFVELCAMLRTKLGMRVEVLGGPADPMGAFDQHRVYSGAPLETVKRVLSGAALFVGNDSGPAHMAAAFGVPSVVLFGPSDPAIWGPWRTANRVLKSSSGISGITFEECAAAVEELVEVKA